MIFSALDALVSNAQTEVLIGLGARWRAHDRPTPLAVP
jgi:hypothetical protein